MEPSAGRITSKRVLVCSVPECTNIQAKRHFIPKKDERIRKIWLQRINNPIFIDKPSSYITAKAVCDIHFEEICKKEDHKLKHYSLPTLYIPGFAGVDDEKERCFSIPPNPYEMKGTPPKLKRLMESFKNRTKKRRLIEDEIQPASTSQTIDFFEEAGSSCPLQTAANMEFVSKIKELNNEDIKQEIVLDELELDESHVDDFYVEIPTPTAEDNLDNQEETDDPVFWDLATEFEKAIILKDENKLVRQKLEEMGVYQSEKFDTNADEANVIDLTDINVVCRICLKKNLLLEPLDKILSFENPGIKSISILDALRPLGLDQVLIEDHLPNNICPECIQYLKLLTMFKYTFEKSFEILQMFSRTIKKGNKNASKIDNVTTQTIKEEVNDSCEANEERIFADNVKIKKRKKNHKCPICFKNLTLSQFRPHIRKHTTLKKYLKAAKVQKKVKYYALPSDRDSLINEVNMQHTCPFCPQSFEATIFLPHINDHLKNDQFACDMCHRVFMKRSYLVQHKLVHMKELPYRCKTCGKQFVTKVNYDYHLLGHTDGELPYKCEHCHKEFSNPLHLKRHKTIHLENISYSDKYKMKRCSGCLQSFVNEAEFQSHTCMWTGNRVLNCRFCRQPLNKLQTHTCSKLVMHKKAAAQKKKYQCSICYKMVGNMTFHKMSAHPETVQKSLCPDCGLYVVNIYLHRMKHKRKKCDICDKDFSSTTMMKKHKFTHTGEKPFLCTFCPKTFTCKYNLQVHERIHTGNKCHVCHICDKGFLEKSYLKKHLKTHKYVM